MVTEDEPYHHGGSKTRAVALLVCIVMMSSAVPIFTILSAGGIHKSIAITPIQDDSYDYARYIQVNNFRFDPLAESPDVPASLSYGTLQPSVETYFIIQLNGPVTQQMKQNLGSAGMQVLYYINYNAFIVVTDGKALDRAKTLPSFRWAGVFEPAYKLSPRLSDSYEQMRAQAIERNIDGASGTVNSPSPGGSIDSFSKSYDASYSGPGPGGISLAGRTSSLSQAPSSSTETTSSPVIDVLITPFEKSRVDEIAKFVSELGGSEIVYSYKSGGVVRAVIDKNAMIQLAREPGVMWIDRQTDPYVFNDIARWVVQSGDDVNFATPIHEHGIWGTGQTVTVGDTGIDYDHNAFRDPYNVIPGPNSRKVTDYYVPSGATGDFMDNGVNHGSHVSGTVAGDDGTWHVYDGDPSGSNRTAGPHDGQAFDAKLQVQDLSIDGNYVGTPADLHDLFQAALDRDSYIHTNSWGDYGYQYISEAAQTDDFLWNNQDFIVCFAAGNYGDGLNSISPYATAKNVISVGATGNGKFMQDVADFSSRGPSADGRLKPDVMAPGSETWSVHGMDPSPTQNEYWQMSGTSMATPTVAGAVALIRQYYMDGFFPTGTKRLGDGFVPSAALVKATLINSATEMTGTGAYANGESRYPNDNQGWGRVLLDDALYFQNDQRGLIVDDERTGLSTGSSVGYNLAIGDASLPVEITLVWTDYPGAPMSSPALVNDLNLVVTAPDGTVYRGNAFQGHDPGESVPDPTMNASDHLNNVESVLIVTNPQIGQWTVTVSGFNVPMGPQPFALVMSGGLVTEEGVIHMDKTKYKSSATVNVRVVDLGLNTDPLSIETITVEMSSTTETVPEMLLLTETGINSAVFSGSIQLQEYAVPTHGDGLLQVQNRDTIAAGYFDWDDGHGGSGPVVDYAVVDDDSPVISGVDVVNIRFNRATVIWTTNENSSSVAMYGESLPPSSSLSNLRLSFGHQLTIRNLTESTTYYFSVESTDMAGNLAIDDNGSAYYEFTTTASPPIPTASDEWPTFHNNMARVGSSPSAFTPPIELQWSSAENYYTLFTSPIMADGILFTTTLDGFIRARDAFTGDLMWQKRLGDIDKYTGTPTVVNGIVYTTFSKNPTLATGGTVYALDERTGEVVWSVGPEAGIDFNARIAMADADGLVFGAAWSGEVFAMNASTGAIEWTYQTEDTPFGGIVVDGGQVFIGTLYTPRIISLDESTGTLLWEHAVDNRVSSTPMVSAGSVYVGTYSGTLYCLDEWSGEVVWQVGGFGPFFYSTPAFDGSYLYFSTATGKCYAVDAFSGSILWNVSFSYSGYGSLAAANGFLYLGAYDGELLVLNASDGSLVDSEPLNYPYDVTSSPSISDGWVWIENSLGAVFAFMGQVPAGIIVHPDLQTKHVAPSSAVNYSFEVKNTGSSGPDTFDAVVTPGALGWAAELFMADGVTPLPDTDSDSIPDTGALSKGDTAILVVRVTVPGSAYVGDTESTTVNIRSSNDPTVDKDVSVVSFVPPPGVDVEPRSYFNVSPGDVRTALMNITNTGAFSDTYAISVLSTNGWNISIFSEDGVTPLPDTDMDGTGDTGPISPFDHVTISVRIEVPTSAVPDTLERIVVTGTSTLDINATSSNVIALELPGAPSNEWPTFHNGNERQGASPGMTAPPLTQQWMAGPYLMSDWSGPVLADGILFSTTVDGYIRANDPYTGALLWSRLIGAEYYYTGTPAVDDGIVYIIFSGFSGGMMYALDEQTGTTVWAFGSERGMDLNAQTPMAVSAGLVFGAAWSGEVFAVNADNGSEVWRFQTENNWPSGVAIHGGAVYLSTYEGTAFALDEFTGQLIWSRSLDGMAVYPPMCADNLVYIGTDGGSMYALDSISGEVVWQRDVGAVRMSTPAYDGSAVYFGATYNIFDGYIYALDARNGSTIWSFDTPYYAESSVAYANGYVFATIPQGFLCTLSASNGTLLDSEILMDGSTSTPAVSNGWVWVQDEMGYLYGFKGAFPVGVDVQPSLQEMSTMPDTTAGFTVSVKNVGSSGADTFDVTLTQGLKGWPLEVFSSDGISPLPDTDSDGLPDTGPLGYQSEALVVVKVSVPAAVAPGDRETSLVTFTSGKDVNVSANGTMITSIPLPGVLIGPGGYRSSPPGSTAYFRANVTNIGGGLDVIDLSYNATYPLPVTLLESDGVTPLVDHDGDGVPDTGVLSWRSPYPIVVAISVPDDAPLDSHALVTLRGTSSADPTKTASVKLLLDIPGPSSLEWPTYQQDSARNGFASQPYDLPLSKMWTYDGQGGDSSYASPIVAGGVVYYTSDSGDVMAVDGRSGEGLWVTHLGSYWYEASSPTYSEGRVFVGYTEYSESHSHFAALDAKTGMVLWTFSFDGYMEIATPVTRAGVLYLANYYGMIYALNADTGDELWHYAVPDVIVMGPSIIDDKLMIGGWNGNVTALNLDGERLWSMTLPSASYSALSGGDGKVFVAGNSGCVYAIDSATGTLLWASDTFDLFIYTAAAYGYGAVFVADYWGEMHALDAETGEELWYYSLPSTTQSPAILNNGTVYQVSSTGDLFMFDAATGDLIDSISVSENLVYSAMAMANGALYVIDDAGTLSAFGFVGLADAASVEVTPPSAVVPLGGLHVFDVVAKNRYGGTLQDQMFTWSVVSGAGSLTPMDVAGERIMFVAGTVPGTTILQVSVGDISTIVRVTVPPGDVREVIVSPSEGFVTVGSSLQFVAVAYDAFGNEVTGVSSTWSSTIGSIDSSGLLSAGVGSGSGTVTASLGSIIGVATVHVLPGPLDHISVSPSSLSVVAGGMATISIVGEDQHGNEITGMMFTWSSTLGMIYPIGEVNEAVFQAGTVVGSGIINVSSGSVSTEIPVAVVPGALGSLVIDPSTAAVLVDEFRQFTVSGSDVYGNPISTLAVVYSVTSGIGSIDGAGMFTAGTAIGTGRIIATSGSYTAEATVTVGPGPLDRIVVVSRDSVTMSVGSVAILSALGYDAHGNPMAGLIFNWSADSGSMILMDGTSEVIYQAGTTAGSRTVTVTNGSLSASLNLSVLPGPLATLVVDPVMVVADPSDSVDLMVRGYDAYGNLVANLVFTWAISSTSSNNDAIGALTTHSDTKIATLVAGTGATGTITVTCGGKSAVVSVTVNESRSALIKAAPSLALAAIIAVVALAVLLVLMLLGKLHTVGKKE